MKALPLVLPLTLIAGLACARIYRPMTLPAPPAPATAGVLAGSLTLQPWGDNSRYQAKARHAGLRVVVLTLENRSGSDLEVLGLEAPDAAAVLSVDTAVGLVKQPAMAYILYPLIPGLLIPGSSNSGSYGPSDQALFSGLAIVSAFIGVPNALVAARSNRRLGAFLREAAWVPGILRPGQIVRGLVFIRSRDPYTPLPLQVRFHAAAGEQRLVLGCPGVAPP